VWRGLKTAAAYFQKTISEILKGLIYLACEAYIDDIIIYGETEEEFLRNNLEKVLLRFKHYNMTFNPRKCVMMGVNETEYVRWSCDQQGWHNHVRRKDSHRFGIS
jgi:hypothetical protein